MNRKYTDDQISEIISLYQSGETVRQIVDMTGVPAATIYYLLRTQSIPTRLFKVTSELAAEIAERYTNGESSTSVANDLGTSHKVICTSLRKSGVALRDASERHRTCNLNEAAFDVWTPEASYWAGFLFADGHITSPSTGSRQLVLRLKISDREHIEGFRGFLQSTHKVTVVRHLVKQRTHLSVGLSVTSSVLADRLIDVGMTNSRVTPRVASPELAGSKHFWRGVVDGDGHLGSRNLPRGRHGHALSVVGDQELMEQFRGFVKSTIGFLPNVNPHKSIYVIQVAEHKALQLAHILYGDCLVDGSPALDRKLKIAERWFAGDFY